MRLDLSQHLRLEQQMKLSPRIIQAMEILQLPILALQERIEAELQSNPVLEQRDPGVDEEAPPVKIDEPDARGEHDMVVHEDHGNREDFERLAEFESEYDPEFIRPDEPVYAASRVDSGERDRKMDAMANAPAPGISLNEHLQDQWRFVEATPEVWAAGEVIIAYIDADGYLRTPLEELLPVLGEGATLEQLRRALLLVQTLEPVGVGARDLQECLLLQLSVEQQSGMDVELEIQLVRHFLRDIEKNRLPQIAKKIGRSIEETKAAIENISHLNPRPGSLIGDRVVPGINPDVIVEVGDHGQVIVSMADGNTPSMYISKAYQRMARDRATDREARKFLKRNILSAQWLMSAVEQRRQTIRRVAEEIFSVQQDFLEHGIESLKPLPMAEVAEKVGVHVATISRAVSGKYAQTPQGIVPLRMFFSGGTTTESGEDVSWDAVKAKLKELISQEDKANPFNDDQLVEEIKKSGIDIARRTVAKYRNALNIPPARKRREY